MSPIPVSESNATAVRTIARRDLDSALKVSRIWAAVFAVLCVAFFVSWFAGAFRGSDRWPALIFFVLFFALMFYGAFISDGRTRRSLALVEGEPRLLTLVSEQRRGAKSKRPVTLRDGDVVVAHAGPRDRRGALFLFTKPVPVFVFGELTPGQRVVVVGPHPRLVASLRLDELGG